MISMVFPDPAEELLRICATALYGFRRQIPRPVLDELCQEATTRTLHAATVENPRPFAYTVARRLALDWLRRRCEVAWDPRVEDRGDGAWQRQIELRIDADRATSALAEAPAAYRELVEALYFRQVDIEDVVRDELVSRGEGTDAYARVRDVVYKRRSRALAWLRQRMTEDRTGSARIATQALEG